MPDETRAMAIAMQMAARVGDSGNVPVGAVVMMGDVIVARAGNLRETLQDPTAHAELLALRDASQRLGTWRLDEATLVVTLEPCAMCAAAIVQARVKRVVYAATEPKTGAHQSIMRMFDGSATEVVQLSEAAPASAALMARFFEDLRRRKRES
jgi:tRNA(adenine34) deaminase